MCLIVERKKEGNRITATEDITCYKVLKVMPSGLYFTPYMETRVYPSELTGEYTFDAHGAYFSNEAYDFKNDNEIHNGFIHTFCYYSDAYGLAKTLSEGSYINEYAVWKCIIPKGTEFYWGYDKVTFKRAYAANKIKFTKEIIKTQNYVPKIVKSL